MKPDSGVDERVARKRKQMGVSVDPVWPTRRKNIKTLSIFLQIGFRDIIDGDNVKSRVACIQRSNTFCHVDSRGRPIGFRVSVSFPNFPKNPAPRFPTPIKPHPVARFVLPTGFDRLITTFGSTPVVLFFCHKIRVFHVISANKVRARVSIGRSGPVSGLCPTRARAQQRLSPVRVCGLSVSRETAVHV